VRQYAIKEPYITGYESKDHVPPELMPKEGYFLINTDNDKIKEEMTEEQWRAELKSIGWENPQLKEPD
jgi:hypothetical protein